MPAPVGVDKEELAVTYAALILHDGDQKVTAEGLNAVLSAAGVNIPKHWSSLFARSLAGRSKEDIDGLLTGGSVGAAGAASAPVAQEAAKSSSAPAAEEKKDSKPKSDSEESEGDMGFGLFD